MPIFTSSTLVAATPEALFRFHENPHNLRAISPPGLRILHIQAGEQAVPGEEFTIAVRQGPITLHWVGRWETVVDPGLLIDTGVQCPFAHWRHHHIFEPHAGGALLTDRVEFRLPWFRGGAIADRIVQHVVLPRMFALRHAATRHYLARAA